MNYSLRQLKVFVTVARARSFSRAGEMIGLSQSAVSHSVKELEHQTGVRLLDRTTREVVLTEAGQQLAGRLERLLDELTITLRDAGRVDLQCEVVLAEPFLLLCREDHPFASLTEVPWQALQDERLILQDYASGSRPLIDAALSRLAIRANIVQEIGHPATLFPMVESGIGISVLPALALPLPQGSHLTVKRLTPVMERQLMLACRKNRSLSTAAQALWEIVREEGENLTAARVEDPLYQR